jgi:hypothetical protein
MSEAARLSARTGSPIRLSMRQLLAFASLALLAGCVAPSAPPPAPARPVPVPAPAPALPPPPAASSDWRDWALTPGNWSYRRAGSGSIATYGSTASSIFLIQCDSGRLSLSRAGATPGPMTIRTSSTARTVPTGALPTNDPLIDAMGYSRGRFVVEQPGAPTLVIPAWPEVLRVAEDCRG